MLSIEEAKARVAERADVAKAVDAIDYGSVYLVRVEYAAEDETFYDPFFSVDKESGAVNEFSFLHDGDPYEIMMRFLFADDEEFAHAFEDDDSLAHYGVKGMKWGVINEDKTGGAGSGKAADPKKTSSAAKVETGSSSKAKAETPAPSKTKTETTTPSSKGKKGPELGQVGNTDWTKVPDKPISKAQEKKNYAESHEKFIKKAMPSNAEGSAEGKKPLTPAQKKAIKNAVVAGVILAAYVGVSIYANKAINESMAKNALDGASPESRLGQFKLAVLKSKNASWGKGYITKLSHEREEFELPAGHVFHRISTGLEDSFRMGTYATHSTEDFNRYVSAFRQEKGLASQFNHVTFKSTEPIKVPNLKTVMDTLHEVMQASSDKPVTPAQVKSQYSRMSGGEWNALTNHAAPLFKALKEKGYGAIVDEMDANVIGESPIVLFAQDKLGPKVNSLMSSDDLKAAENAVIDFAKHK